MSVFALCIVYLTNEAKFNLLLFFSQSQNFLVVLQKPELAIHILRAVEPDGEQLFLRCICRLVQLSTTYVLLFEAHRLTIQDPFSRWLQCLSMCTNLVSYKWARANYRRNEGSLSILRNCRSLRVVDNASRWIWEDSLDASALQEPVTPPLQGLMHIGAFFSVVDFPSFSAWAQRYFRTLTSLDFEVCFFSRFITITHPSWIAKIGPQQIHTHQTATNSRAQATDKCFTSHYQGQFSNSEFWRYAISNLELSSLGESRNWPSASCNPFCNFTYQCSNWLWFCRISSQMKCPSSSTACLWYASWLSTAPFPVYNFSDLSSVYYRHRPRWNTWRYLQQKSAILTHRAISVRF